MADQALLSRSSTHSLPGQPPCLGIRRAWEGGGGVTCVCMCVCVCVYVCVCVKRGGG